MTNEPPFYRKTGDHTAIKLVSLLTRCMKFIISSSPVQNPDVLLLLTLVLTATSVITFSLLSPY
jgi:hypothetical protein